MNGWMAAGLSALGAYLLGSLSFGILTTRLFAHKDIRAMGSGNAGMTNVLRSAGALPGILTGAGDFAKGAAAILLGRWLFGLAGWNVYVGGCLAALFVLAGHLFPLYFGFRGGKGVMTSAGILLVLNPLALAILVVVFLIAFAVSKTVSVGSLAVAAGFPAVTLALCLLRGEEWWAPTLLAAGMGALIFYTHRANLARLRAGTEPKTVVRR